MYASHLISLLLFCRSKLSKLLAEERRSVRMDSEEASFTHDSRINRSVRMDGNVDTSPITSPVNLADTRYYILTLNSFYSYVLN